MNKHTIGGRLEYNHEDDRTEVAVRIELDPEGDGYYTDRVLVWSVDGDPLMPYRFEGKFPVLYLAESVESDSSAAALTPDLLIALIDDIRTSLREAGWKIL